MKQLITFILVTCLLLLTSCYTKYELLEEDSDLSIVTVTDLHFISNTTIHPNSSIKKENMYGDGRLVLYSEELVDAFIYEMKEICPDVIVITGDLTFNGAKKNHQELIKKLSTLTSMGIRVLVTPGNHDTNSVSCYEYNESTANKIDTITPNEFYKLYKNFGYKQAKYYNAETGSYIFEVAKDFWIVMLDSGMYTDGKKQYTLVSGEVRKSDIDFLNKHLKYAKDNDIEVICGMHHAIFSHSEIFDEQFRIKNYEEVTELFEKYDVKLNLAGHMHIQQLANNTKIYEALTGSLAIYGHNYGLIEYINDQSFTYEAKSIDMKTYCKSVNITDPNLLNLLEYSKDYFKRSSYEKSFFNIMMDDSTLTELANAIGTVQSLLNPEYFYGYVNPITYEKVINSEEYKVLLANKNSINLAYINTMLAEHGIDHRNFKINL